MRECWKPVVGYEDVYSVSNKGRVRREKACQGTHAGKIVNLQESGIGYWNINLSKNSQVYTAKVHNVVAEAFLGQRPSGAEVNHIDGDKKNNTVTNLEYVSPEENQHHAHRTGLCMNHGETHYAAKLSDKQIDEIRRIFAEGCTTQKVLACRFSVRQDHISRIVRNKVRQNKWR